ncbi:SRPBCC domain-containing protein [Okibacterium fritillariae]|uniref:SRPBCC domain-containing protein n=1 Tax=Okibacterium fritillariae TaxID=123320 RepID=UPI0040554B56
MAAEPTGRREAREFGEAVVFDRRFEAGIDEVWASITESAELQQWVGEWTGDPGSGSVQFRMTAEGDDVPAETVYLDECSAPSRLRARIYMGGGPDGDENGSGESEPDASGPGDEWHWEITLAQTAGVTTLTFAQSVDGSIPVSDVAPGWEYYLDRLAAYLAGEDVSAINFERDYHPAQCEFYTSLFAETAASGD